MTKREENLNEGEQETEKRRQTRVGLENDQKWSSKLGDELTVGYRDRKQSQASEALHFP